MELKPQMVVVESPFAGDFQRNFRYALWVQRALWEAGFEPLASHTNCPWYADDENPEERARGMAWKWTWRTQAPHVFAMDLGESGGMVAAARKCAELQLGMECIKLEEEFPEHWACFQAGEWPPHTRGIELLTRGTVVVFDKPIVGKPFTHTVDLGRLIPRDTSDPNAENEG